MDHIVLLLVCVAPVVRCYSSGQVEESCGTMQPRHSGLSPQTVPAPFTITTDRSSYSPGQGALGSTPFSGFLLQAREVGGQSAVGSFTLTTNAAQLLTCSQNPVSFHSNIKKKKKKNHAFTLICEKWIWCLCSASFVQNFRTFWVDVTTPALTFTKPSTSGSASSTTPATTTTISSTGCGVTKVCFSQPANCDPAVRSDCYFMSAMMSSPTDRAIHFEMTGPSNGYIAFGFSDDQKMGNDDIYICGTGSNGQVWLQHAFSTGRTTPQTVPLGNVSDVKASVHNGVISCSFTSMNTISTQRTTGLNNTYYLMFAHGPTTNGNVGIVTDKIDISNSCSIPTLNYVSGTLMLIAWMTTGTLGMMVARYMKGMAKGQNLCGKDVWFLVHVAVMSVTVAATIIAFILVFSYARDWSDGAHPVLGCLVMILSFLQPIVALLRCGPQHRLRYVFNWSHFLNAVVIKVLAVAAIFTGLRMIDRTEDQWLVKVMGGFFGWEINTDALLMVVFLLGNLTFLVALLVGIGNS
uniref:Uncharacterized protein n=1 Tax=Lates calcarifer TaxID=8187 RepID=A0A4W6EYT5_LATCA